MEVTATYHPPANFGEKGTVVCDVSIWSNAWFKGTKASYRVTVFDARNAVLGLTQWRTHVACSKTDPFCPQKLRFQETFAVDPKISSRVKNLSVNQVTGAKSISKQEQQAIWQGQYVLLELLSEYSR